MKKNSFVGGTLIATLSIVITKILGIVYVIPFYRMIGSKGSALYSYAYNIYVIFLDICTCGLPIAVSKIINKYDTLNMIEKKMQAFYISKIIILCISIIGFVLLFLFSPFISAFLVGDFNGDVKQVTIVIRCVSFSLLIVPLLSVIKGYLQGHNVISISGVSQIIEQVVKVIIALFGSYIIIYILNKDVLVAVSVSLIGTFIGGLCSFIYIKFKAGKVIVKDKIIDKKIIKELFSYSIPFIIVNAISSLYNFVDMSIILKGFSYLNYDSIDIEFISSSVTTWAPKINMVVTSIAMGMSMSLIPTIVNLFILKKIDHVNSLMNQAIRIILFVSLPLIIFISYYSGYVWTMFYGYSYIGDNILEVNVLLSLLINIFMILSGILQGLNKFKIVYISTIIGFGINIILDFPLIILFDKFGYGYWGTIVSSILGYSFSIWFIIHSLSKSGLKCEFIKFFYKMLIPLSVFFLVMFLVDKIIVINVYSRLSCLIFLVISGMICFGIYFVICLKKGIITNVFGRDIIKKLTFGKIS